MSVGALTLVVTGATGFLGRRTVACALARGHAVKALGRSADKLAAQRWASEPRVEKITADLALDSANAVLDRALEGASAVIHLAAALTGDDNVHARNTVAPTRRALAALARKGENKEPVPRMVLASSLSVYGYAALPDGAMLDEATPLEPDPQLRDAYCRAKIKQEALIRDSTREHALEARILRPGVIFGPGRLNTARLGFGAGPVLLMPSGRAAVPAIHVDACAEALVLAVETSQTHTASNTSTEVINVVDDVPPTQAEYADALRASGWPRAVILLPRGPLVLAATIVSFAEELLHLGVARRLPGAMRAENLHARFKPLRYSNDRLRDRLGWRSTHSFMEAMRASMEGSKA